MTEQAPEQQPQGNPQDNPQDPPPAPDEGAQTPEQVRAQPNTTKGSGQYAVWDQDLGQFVSGVSSKGDADKARKSLEAHNGVITDGHTLTTVEV